MTNRTDTAELGFALLDDDDKALSAAPVEAAAPVPAAEPQAAAQPAVAERPVRQVPPMNTAVPREYTQPALGGVLPLAEHAHADFEARDTSTALAADATSRSSLGVSKIKLGITVACLVAAVAIGLTIFGHSPTPTSAPVATTAAPAAQPGVAGAPTTAAPTAQVGGQPATSVGIDVGNTQAIPLDTGGDIDMIEQWATVSSADQSCTSQILSPYLQKVCNKVSKQRYFQCAPDGFHWDPRLPGCAAL
jgi:hypothetical protein